MACQANTVTLLAKMSRADKAAQMVMADTGSASPGQLGSPPVGAMFAGGGSNPGGANDANAWASWTDGYYNAVPNTPLQIPILFGLDTVHGQNGALGTVIFPHNAGMASSRNAAFVYQVAQAEAQEILATGVNWAFAPFAGTTWDYRWGRVYESFSEDPTWAGEMLTAEIQGFQGLNGLGSATSLMACSKHAAGDGQAGPPSAKGGVVDRGNVTIDQTGMEQWGLAQYVPAINAGLGCIMVSDATWNGTSMTFGSSAQTLLGLLKGQYGFNGFIITDWNAAQGNEEAAINAGVDMLMQPAGYAAAVSTINNDSNISDQRINDAVTRILNAKCQAGLMGVGGPAWKRDPSLIASVGSQAHRTLGRQAVAQSLVVLQNNNSALPISKTANVYVDGSGADNLDNQCGGWSISWQGSAPGCSSTSGTTIKAGINNVKGTVGSMSAADVVVIVLSEHPYAEFQGDSMTLDTLPASDFALLSQARQSGKKVVAVIVSGRPVLINAGSHGSALTDADAWVAAWLPGTEGDGVADVLFGDYHPTGKLSHSWPADDGSANIMCGMGYAGLNCGNYQPMFALGSGLTY
jgi:beta-glucosidase